MEKCPVCKRIDCKCEDKLIHPKEDYNTQDKIVKLMNNFRDFLLEKNKRYGDSALNPLSIFSKAEPNNRLCRRIDEKLQRILNSEDGLRKNDVSDIMGYIILLLIDKNWTDFKDQID